jgi:WD40 repeat protein
MLWDLASRTPTPLRDPSASNGPAAFIEFLPDGRTLCVGKQDGTIELWDREARRLKRKLQGHSREFVPHQATATRDLSRLISVAYHMPPEMPISQITRGALSLLGLRTRPAVRISRAEVAVWDFATGRLLALLPDQRWLILSPDGKILAASDLDGVLTLWDLAGTPLR